MQNITIVFLYFSRLVTSSGQKSEISDYHLHPAIAAVCGALGEAYQVGARPVESNQGMPSVQHPAVTSNSATGIAEAGEQPTVSRIAGSAQDPAGFKAPAELSSADESRTLGSRAELSHVDQVQSSNQASAASSTSQFGELGRRGILTARLVKCETVGRAEIFTREPSKINFIRSSSSAKFFPPISSAALPQARFVKYCGREQTPRHPKVETEWPSFCCLWRLRYREKQSKQHFNNSSHKKALWSCTPKYCAPCGIYGGFPTEQFWKAHISSRRHNSTISKLPVSKQIPNEYGFTN